MGGFIFRESLGYRDSFRLQKSLLREVLSDIPWVGAAYQVLGASFGNTYFVQYAWMTKDGGTVCSFFEGGGYSPLKWMRPVNPSFYNITNDINSGRSLQFSTFV